LEGKGRGGGKGEKCPKHCMHIWIKQIKKNKENMEQVDFMEDKSCSVKKHKSQSISKVKYINFCIYFKVSNN
jgi:hypothetical protein